MRRAIVVPVAVALPILLMGCRDGYVFGSRANVVGSGHVQVEERPVRGVLGVSVGGVGKVFVEQAGYESLTITAESNLLPLLTSELHGGVLVLGSAPGVSISPTRDIVYRLTVRELSDIVVSGAAEVYADGLSTPYLLVTISGVGWVETAGCADEQHIEVSGDGTYLGDYLASRRAAVHVSGVGAAVVRVSEFLDAHVSGEGVIEFFGQPVVRDAVSGAGTIVWRGP
jgi:hypothetical protein